MDKYYYRKEEACIFDCAAHSFYECLVNRFVLLPCAIFFVGSEPDVTFFHAHKHASTYTHTHKITILGYCLFSLKLFLVAMESLLSLLYIFPLLLLRCQTLVFLSRKIKTLTASLSSKPPSVARHSFPVSLLVAVNIFVLPRLLRESHGHADTGSLWFMSRLFFPPQSY